MVLIRHFTATAFVVHDGKIALHWHHKVEAWLPPGGHIEPNEDPVQAALREVQEETGLEAQVVPTGDRISLDYPTQVDTPYTIMIEDIEDPVDGHHQHIDMIYFCRPLSAPSEVNDGWRWVSKGQLINGDALTRGDGHGLAPPEDVCLLGIRAIDFVASQGPT